jgi:superfamily I DNA/RNA helicase
MNDTWWIGPEQLNDEQKAVISLPLKGSHFVLGPPGSGKTNLLLLRANYMTLAGQANIMVLVFTRTLQEFIIAGGDQYAFPASKVRTCRKWEQEFLYGYGVRTEPPEDFEEQRAYFIEQMEELIRKKKLVNVYDAILLDEAQDYLPEEISIFRKLGKVLFAVADSRQKIYNVTDCMDRLQSVVDEQHPLRFHYRIGSRICKLADALAKDSADYEPLLPTSNYNESAKPSSVEHFRCAGTDDEARRIIEKLTVQLKAYPDELLGVICPTNEALLRIWEHIERSELASVAILQGGGEHAAFDPDKRICLCTLHSAKSLEFRGLHIAGCEFLKKFPLQRNMAFTAVTRAKTSLSLYYSDEIPGYLEQALNTLQPLPDLPNLKEVFGRKKR